MTKRSSTYASRIFLFISCFLMNIGSKNLSSLRIVPHTIVLKTSPNHRLNCQSPISCLYLSRPQGPNVSRVEPHGAIFGLTLILSSFPTKVVLIQCPHLVKTSFKQKGMSVGLGDIIQCSWSKKHPNDEGRLHEMLDKVWCLIWMESQVVLSTIYVV